MDIAFQASPDHPWVAEHRDWFLSRPDGTIQYAENPPKKYQDIYPFHFESAEWRELWFALTDVFRFWIGKGVRIFRVDNPHTKPLPFWQWCIRALKSEFPDVIFLAGGLHQAEDHVLAGEMRLQPVVYLFCVAEHRARVDRLFQRDRSSSGE